MYKNISSFIVTIFLSGALSLTAITLNRVIGIAMPRLANMLEMNRFIVYAILAFIWIVSFGTAVPTFNFRRYDVYYFKDYIWFRCVEGE